MLSTQIQMDTRTLQNVNNWQVIQQLSLHYFTDDHGSRKAIQCTTVCQPSTFRGAPGTWSSYCSKPENEVWFIIPPLLYHQYYQRKTYYCYRKPGQMCGFHKTYRDKVSLRIFYPVTNFPRKCTLQRTKCWATQPHRITHVFTQQPIQHNSHYFSLPLNTNFYICQASDGWSGLKVPFH
jgi:hypothetical protein